MTEFENAIYVLLGWAIGLLLGYIIWSPLTPFYKSFINGLSLKFIWGRFIK